MWLSLVERCVRDAEAAGSNPVASIFLCPAGSPVFIRTSGVFMFDLVSENLYIFGPKWQIVKDVVKKQENLK